MKKIILLVLLLFCVNVSAKDVETKFTGFTNTKINSNKETTSKLNYIYIDGKISYCIEPGVIIGENNYIETDDFNSVGINNQLREFLELVVYYGYEYEGHNNVEYYMATQQIIWEKLGSKNIVFKKNGVVVDIKKYRQDIYDLVEKHNIIPDIKSETYNVFVDEKLIIEDKNNKIKDYTSDNENVKIEDNKIIFQSSEVKNYSVSFTNKVKPGISLVYYNPSKHNIATFTLNNKNEKTFTINISVKDKVGNLTITKVDSDTKNILEGSSFELYLDDLLVDKMTTDKDGKLTFSNLVYGNYTLKEVKAPKGYIILDDSINITVDEEQENYIVENSKYEMPVTSDIDNIYYKMSSFLLLLGLIINYVSKKMF